MPNTSSSQQHYSPNFQKSVKFSSLGAMKDCVHQTNRGCNKVQREPESEDHFVPEDVSLNSHDTSLNAAQKSVEDKSGNMCICCPTCIGWQPSVSPCSHDGVASHQNQSGSLFLHWTVFKQTIRSYFKSCTSQIYFSLFLLAGWILGGVHFWDQFTFDPILGLIPGCLMVQRVLKTFIVLVCLFMINSWQCTENTTEAQFLCHPETLHQIHELNMIYHINIITVSWFCCTERRQNFF